MPISLGFLVKEKVFGPYRSDIKIRKNLFLFYLFAVGIQRMSVIQKNQRKNRQFSREGVRNLHERIKILFRMFMRGEERKTAEKITLGLVC